MAFKKADYTNNTLIVIASVIVIGIVIWAFDAIFQYGIFRFIKK